jgi:hemerythrin-like domain-containing protein
MSGDVSFVKLVEVHQWLDQLFLAHQTSLLSLELDTARAGLNHYQRELHCHIDDEEKRLIPIYQARTNHVPGGAVELFTGEHEKLKNFLVEFDETLQRLRPTNNLALKHQIIQLFDRQAIFKGLTEHHHAREQNILFPWLDRITSTEEKISLLAQCDSLTAFKAFSASAKA